MTTHPIAPAPRWTILRDHTPEIHEDLVDLWARLDNLPNRAAQELRWLVEHLGTLIEDYVGRHVESGCLCRYEDDWDEADHDDDDTIGLVTL